MIDRENLFESDFTVALYKHLEHGWTSVFQFHDGNDGYDGYVRISEPMSFRFTKLSDEVAIQNAIKTIDDQERKARLELEKVLARLREQKASLMALTYEGAAA